MSKKRRTTCYMYAKELIIPQDLQQQSSLMFYLDLQLIELVISASHLVFSAILGFQRLSCKIQAAESATNLKPSICLFKSVWRLLLLHECTTISGMAHDIDISV